MIGLRQRKPIDWLVSVVAGVCPYCQPNLGPDGGSNWSTSSISPTITSGPGTRFGSPELKACCMGGMTIDLVSPLTR